MAGDARRCVEEDLVSIFAWQNRIESPAATNEKQCDEPEDVTTGGKRQRSSGGPSRASIIGVEYSL